MVNLVISDLDGTLLNAEHKVSSNTLDVVNALTDIDVTFAVATGRHYADICYLRDAIPGGAFFISSNGAMVHSWDGALLHQTSMDTQTVEDLLRLSESYPVHTNLYCGDDWYVEEHNERLLSLHTASGFTYQVVNFKAVDTFNKRQTAKVFFIGEHHVLCQLKTAIESFLGKRINAVFSLEDTLEVMAPDVTKGRALEDIFKNQQLGQFMAEKSLAFGDGMNDLEMLSLVRHRVVMANARPELPTSLGPHQLAKANHEDGVAEFLRTFFW